MRTVQNASVNIISEFLKKFTLILFLLMGFSCFLLKCPRKFCHHSS